MYRKRLVWFGFYMCLGRHAGKLHKSKQVCLSVTHTCTKAGLFDGYAYLTKLI